MIGYAIFIASLALCYLGSHTRDFGPLWKKGWVVDDRGRCVKFWVPEQSKYLFQAITAPEVLE